MWQAYSSLFTEHTVQGELLVYPAMYSPQLNNKREIFVWLPLSYRQSGRRYPVLYMHDGQNLFDVQRSYAGEWEVDETMQRLATEGIEAIIVGLPNMGEQRMAEYNPYPGWNLRGRGSDYIEFLTQTVKPFIDAEFRTRPEAAATGIAGSSMGGLISLYGWLTQPQVFGFCGAFSPVFWLGRSKLQAAIAHAQPAMGRVYLDVGTAEGEVIARHSRVLRLILGGDPDAEYSAGVRGLHDALMARGFGPAALRYVEEEGAPHHESAWARRLPAALRFLLGPLALQT